MNPFTTTIQKGIIIALGVVIVALAAFGGTQWFIARSLRSDLEDCRIEKAKLSGSLELQNGAVASWQAAASAAQEVSAKALVAAKQANAGRVAESKRLADLQVLAKSQACGPAMDEIRKGLR